jgi:hypothetical protein
MSIRVFGLLPLAKSSEPWQKTDTDTLLAPAAATLATVCGRSKIMHDRKNFRMFKFS